MFAPSSESASQLSPYLGTPTSTGRMRPQPERGLREPWKRPGAQDVADADAKWAEASASVSGHHEGPDMFHCLRAAVLGAVGAVEGQPKVPDPKWGITTGLLKVGKCL